MTRSLDVFEEARTDLTNHYVWLATEAGLDVAEAMSASADDALFLLVEQPGVGSPVKTRRPELAGLRKRKVPGFPKLLIFYLHDDDVVFVIRVFHASQDWIGYLEAE